MESPTIRCPICKKSVPGGASHFPFCSERCKLADLGHWMDESYRIGRRLRPYDVDSFEPESGDLADPSGESPY